MSDEMVRQIATEAAEALVQSGQDKGYSSGEWLRIGKIAIGTPNTAALAIQIIGDLEEAFLAAIERALRQTPLPSGMSDERLAEIMDHVRRDEPPGRLFGGAWMTVRDLLDDLALHRRILSDADVPAAVVREAYEAGVCAGSTRGRQAPQRKSSIEEDHPYLWEKLREVAPGATSGEIEKIIEAILGTCTACLSAPAGCQCWNDE